MKIDRNQLQGTLQERLAHHRVPGASIAVLHDGEITTAAAGIANVTTGVELTPQTVMHVGSIAKVFNATLVMQLVDEGKVDLEQPLLRYLPDLKLKDRDALEQMSVKMLLNHTCGMDGEWLPDYGHDEETIEKAIRRFAELGQKHRPGEDFSYCNAGMVIAGYLAQRLTGRSWYRLIRERIFEPLALEHAAALPEEAVLHRASVGHYLDPVTQKAGRTSFAFLALSFAPAGATLMLSARDLIKFAQAHIANGLAENGARILSERSARAMQRMTVNNKGKIYPYGDGVGLGWLMFENGLLVHHGGGPGIVAMLYVHPPSGFAAAVLTNAEHALSLVNDIVEPWIKDFGDSRPMGIADTRLPSEPVSIEADRYIGVYEDVMMRYVISRTPDGIALSRQARFAYYENVSSEQSPRAKLIPLGGEKFLLETPLIASPSYDEFRIFTFRKPDVRGRSMQLGNSMRLYPRVS
jgi:CubicO group peptidase (beta-lactamase class C family)